MKNTMIYLCGLLAFVSFSHAQVANFCYGVTDNTFVPDIGNCSNYYTCLNNVGYLQTCPGSFLFSSAKQACDYATDVECLTCPTGATPAELSFLPIPGVCDKYIICAGGSPFMQPCLSGLEFNTVTLKCDFASNVNCATKPAACPPSTDSALTFVPGGGGCTKYTICFQGTGFSQTCATGTIFNPGQNACVPDSTYTCTTSATATSARSLIPPGVAQSSSFEMKYRKSALCPPVGTKSLPHDRSCSKYLFCVNGQSALLSCAGGLHFDSVTETCRLPADADCKV